MSGSTTELSLATAVDSDDNADYLTLSLANSLRTVDALFNNITGHTHNGAHQGAPVPASTIPNGSISNAQLGPDVARANLLTNSGFEIWQRGLATVFTGSSHNADGWEASLAAGDAMSVQRDNAVVDTGSMNAAFVAYTKSSGGSQLIQAMNDRVYRGKTLSLSVRVYANAIGAVQAFIYDNVLGFRQGAANVGPINTWETLTFTAPISPTATSSGVGLWFSNSVQVRVDNAMLVVGSQPSDYAPLHPADDLARCQRYYEVWGAGGDQSLVVMGIASAAGQFAQNSFMFQASKPVAPTVTVTGTWALTNATGPGLAFAGLVAARMSINSAAGGQFFGTNGGAGSGITVESNP